MKKIFALPFVLFACTGNPATPANPVAASGFNANDLIVEASACWLGGMWGDVQGETPMERTITSHTRCENVVSRTFTTDPHARYEQLRAHEAETISEVRANIGRLAQADARDLPRKDALLRVFDAMNDAEKEAMLARRAAHRIVRDADREAEALSASEAAALPELEASRAFVALLHAGDGDEDLRKEAHVFFLLVALDRMHVAEQLPVHLKPYVVAEPMHDLFAMPMPDLPHDASKPLARGGWLAYLTSAAEAAHHPVSDASKPPQARHEEAIAGILEGVADLLKTDVGALDQTTPLPRVTQLMIRALEQSRERAM